MLKRPRLKTVDELMGVSANDKLIIQNLLVSELKSFRKHPFKLYKGERLEDMVESIKTNGVMIPIIVRPINSDGIPNELYEILSGHNRVNASIIAGLETVPAIVLESDMSDEKARAYVIETNLMQRSFTDLSHTEKAAVLAQHYEYMFSPGKRTDIIACLEQLEQGMSLVDPKPTWGDDTYDEINHTPGLKIDDVSYKGIFYGMPGPGETWNSAKLVGDMYGMTRNTVSRYVRIHRELDLDLKEMLDNGRFNLMAAESLSFLRNGKDGSINEQGLLAEVMNRYSIIDVTRQTAIALRQASSEETLNEIKIKSILEGKILSRPKRPPSVIISNDVYTKYFTDVQSPDDVTEIVEDALQFYFEMGNGKDIALKKDASVEEKE